MSKIKKWIAIGCIALITGLVGCIPNGGTQQTRTSESEIVDTGSAVDGAVTMDFTAPLELKKPKTPVSQSPYVLFIGNSFTFYNELPVVFRELAKSGGYTPEVYEISDGGYKFQMFADSKDELGAQVQEALTEYEWDYVILQEQSRVPTIDGIEEIDGVDKTMFEPARLLDGMIKQANAETVFLMTWAYKNGDDLSDLGIDRKTSREEMQIQLTNSYMKIANELDSLVAPAGVAWMRATTQYPEIELWDEDLMHPSPTGTYLTACVMYSTLFDESPVGLTYIGDMEQSTAQKLQQIAADTVNVGGNK